MTEKFENDWTRTHDAMKANIEAKEKLIDRLIRENMELLEVCKAALVYTQSDSGIYPLNEKLRAAIAEAKGGKNHDA